MQQSSITINNTYQIKILITLCSRCVWAYQYGAWGDGDHTAYIGEIWRKC